MKFIENLKEEEYTKFVENHETSHFLKSYEWGEISKERGFTPYYVGEKENGKMIATALLLKKQLPFGYSYFYIPRGYTLDYQDSDLLQKLTEDIKIFTKKQHSLFFKIDPDIYLHHIDEEANPIVEKENHYELVKTLEKIGFHHRKLTKFFETMQPRYTFRVDLKRSMEEIRKNYSKSVIRWMKLADKYQVETHIGTSKQVEEFVRLMKLTEKRQNFFSHEYSFYSKFYDLFHQKGYIDLLYATVNPTDVLAVVHHDLEMLDDKKEEDLVRYQKLMNMQEHFAKLDGSKKQIVSAYFNVNYGNKSWYLYGANDMDYKLTYANYKLFDFQIQNAHQKKKEIFDEFGTIGDVHTKKSVIGLHEFKKKFGGEYIEFIGEFDYITNPLMYFVFIKLVPLYRKPLKFFHHLKVKMQKGE